MCRMAEIVGCCGSWLFMCGCQSAEDRQAAELREFLYTKVAELEPLNTRLVAQYESYLQEEQTRGNEREAGQLRRRLATLQDDLPAELDDLRRRIADYPNVELPTLSQVIKDTIAIRTVRIQGVAEERDNARRAAEVIGHWERFGESLMRPRGRRAGQ